MTDFHIPVLLEPTCASFAPALRCESSQNPATSELSSSSVESGSRPTLIIDATCGGGGHSAALLERFVPQLYLVLDRDPEALAHATPRLKALAERVGTQLKSVHARFSELDRVLDELTREDSRWARANAILADIGVSSHQLDAQNRGFSFRQDAPLDMRMDPTQGESAAQLLSRLDANAIAKILRDYGEEPDAQRIAQALAQNPPRTTFELAQRVTDAMSAVGRRKLGKRVHPATRSFQALRIAVNAEFDELDALLEQAPARLLHGGRLGIITFHSLEDRRVKRAFRSYCQVTKPPAGLPIVASELPQPRFCLPKTLSRGIDADPKEIADNPRSRSARLRILERTLAP